MRELCAQVKFLFKNLKIALKNRSSVKGYRLAPGKGEGNLGWQISPPRRGVIFGKKWPVPPGANFGRKSAKIGPKQA